jgi:hypothetical protein
MSWDTERARAGKRPFQYVEIELDRCSLTYGETPCAAALGVTGDDKCFNGWETCQDEDAFDPASYFIRFAEANAEAPRIFDFAPGSPADEGLDVFLPFLRGVSHSPGLPDPGESLGIRAQVTVDLQDAPHHDIGIDKYIAERGYDAYLQGTFFRKLRARFPHYIGRLLRWYQGYIVPGGTTTLEDFRVREYIIERVDGPDAGGRIRIVAKDVMKLLDDERAVAPRKSTGTLNEVLSSGVAEANINVLTTDGTEYDLPVGDAIGYVRIGGEVISYTGVTVLDATQVRLTGCTRNNPPGDYETSDEAHAVGDAVQVCRYLSGTVPEVVNTLMTEYGDVDAAYIPFSEWDAEADTWLAGDDISRLITEPEGVRSLVNEIIGQTLVWGFWVDEIDQEIKFRALRPADVGDEVQEVNDDAHIVAGSVRVADDPDSIINEVQVVYGQLDPTKQKEEMQNYRGGAVALDADSQSVNETGQRRMKRIFARWHPTANAAVVARFAERTLSSKLKNLTTVEFQLERKDESVRTANFCDLTTIYITDEFGVPRTMRVQVMRSTMNGERMTYRAREDFFKVISAFGRWAPEELDGVSITDTGVTDEQRERYMAWCQDDGTFTDASEGKVWT